MLLEEIPSAEKVLVLAGGKIQAENTIEEWEIELAVVQELELV